MDFLHTIGSWISENESLLSGTAAIIVLAGVLLSPFGVGIRQLFRGGSSERSDGTSVASSADSPEHLTLKDLTAPSPYKTQFAQSDGVRIAFNERGSGPHNLVVTPGIISHLNIMAHLPVSRDSLGSLSQFARVITFDKRGQGLSDPARAQPRRANS